MDMTMESSTFAQQWDLSDTVIIVESEKLYVHKSILSICSPVFKTMLSSDFKEGTSLEIRLPGKQKEKIKEMLRHMYPFPAQITEHTDISSLLSLAREYQMQQLTNRVEETLLRRQSSVELLILAQEYELLKIVEKCTCTLSRVSFNDVKSHPKYEDISAENLVSILQGNLKFMKDQHTREIRNLVELHNKKRHETLEIVNEINSCWGYNKLPIRGCTCPSYTKSCSDCNNALEKFIKVKCGELIEHIEANAIE